MWIILAKMYEIHLIYVSFRYISLEIIIVFDLKYVLYLFFLPMVEKNLIFF